MIPWRDLCVWGSNERLLYGTHKRRALTRWRAGRALLLTVRRGLVEARIVTDPATVDWTGWVDEPGRRGGKGTPRSRKKGEWLPEMRVPEGTAAVLAGLVARSTTGETPGEIVARALRAQAGL